MKTRILLIAAPLVVALGLAIGAYHVWRRLPPAQRKRVLQTARTHGPKVAAAILARRKTR